MKNVQLKLDEALLNRVKHIAVDDDKSVSAWVSDLIVTSLKERDEYEAARKGALNDLNKRLRLGGTRLTREELHKR